MSTPPRKNCFFLSLLMIMPFMSCAGSNDKRVESLISELETERKLLSETRAELQALVATLEPLLAASKLADNVFNNKNSEGIASLFGNDVGTPNPQNQANKFYDQAEYSKARSAALKILEKDPGDVRMARLVVSASCLLADKDGAVAYFAKLPARDQRQMSRRCQRYGIEFDDSLLVKEATDSGHTETTLKAAPIKIKKISGTKFEIDRKTLDEMLANPARIFRQARIVPSIKDGKANGFKLYAIRPNSVYALLGLANGDTIHKINEFDLTSADRALEAYTQLKNRNKITLHMTRRGKSLSIRYDIK